MVKNLDKRKYKLIQEIINIDDESALSLIEDQIQVAQQTSAVWNKAIRPLRKAVTLEEMVREQEYQPMTAETFFKLADDLEIKESIEELLTIAKK